MNAKEALGPWLKRYWGLEIVMSDSHTVTLSDAANARFAVTREGRAIHDDDFMYDAKLAISGDFVDDAERVAYATELVRRLNLVKRKDEITDMWLCEATKVTLHIGQLYRFTPNNDCESCQKLKREHDEAYGCASDSAENEATK